MAPERLDCSPTGWDVLQIVRHQVVTGEGHSSCTRYYFVGSRFSAATMLGRVFSERMLGIQSERLSGEADVERIMIVSEDLIIDRLDERRRIMVVSNFAMNQSRECALVVRRS